MSTHKIAFPRLFDGSAQKGISPANMDRILLLKGLRMLLICGLMSVATAITSRFFSKPAYQITSVISMAESATNPRDALTIYKSKTADDIQQKVNAEVDFLTSRSNLAAIVQRFNLSVNYRKAGLIRDKDLYLESPVDFQRTRMGAQRAGQFTLSIKNRGTFVLKPEKGKAQEYAFNTTYTDDLGSWQVSKMPNISGYIGTTIHVDILDPELAADKLQSNLDVTQGGKPPSMLKLSIEDPVLTRGNDVLNALLITYLENSEAEKERLAQSQLRFIDARLITLNQDLNRLDKELSASASGSNKKAGQKAVTMKYLYHVKANDKQLNTLNLKIAALNELKSSLQDRRSLAADTVNSAIADPTLNAMASALFENKLTYKRLLQTHLADDPEVTETLQQFKRQKRSLLKEIGGRLAPMLSKREKLMTKNAAYAVDISALPQDEIESINLKRKMQVIPDLYAELLRSRENAAMNHASFLAFSKPMNSSLMVAESKHFSLVALVIGFAIPLAFFLLKGMPNAIKSMKSNP